MANVTTAQTIERRIAIMESWSKGIRTAYKLAKLHNCDESTVKKDLALLKRFAQRKVTDADINAIRREEDAALVNDIAQIETLVEEVRAAKPEKQKGTVEGGKVVQGSVEKASADPYAVVALIDRKMKMRRMRQELWGLVNSQKGGVSVVVSAQASASTELQESKKDDIPDAIRKRIISTAERAEAEACLRTEDRPCA